MLEFGRWVWQKARNRTFCSIRLPKSANFDEYMSDVITKTSGIFDLKVLQLKQRLFHFLSLIATMSWLHETRF